MALFKSQILTSVSGSVGGTTFSHNAGGMYMRGRGIPTQPNTPTQIQRRANFSQLSPAWSQTLTDAQRLDWNVFAQNTPTTNPLGDSVFRSGFAWFMGNNSARLSGTGLSTILDGPAIFGGVTFNIPTVSSVTASTNTASIAFDNTDGWANETGGALIIYVSRPQSPGVSFFKGPYQFAGQITGDDTTPPTSPADVVLPFNFTAGQKVFFRFTFVSADGRVSREFSDFQGAVI